MLPPPLVIALDDVEALPIVTRNPPLRFVIVVKFEVLVIGAFTAAARAFRSTTLLVVPALLTIGAMLLRALATADAVSGTVVVELVVVADVRFVFASVTGGFAATVGDGKAPDEMVGVSVPVLRFVSTVPCVTGSGPELTIADGVALVPPGPAAN